MALQRTKEFIEEWYTCPLWIVRYSFYVVACCAACLILLAGVLMIIKIANLVAATFGVGAAMFAGAALLLAFFVMSIVED